MSLKKFLLTTILLVIGSNTVVAEQILGELEPATRTFFYEDLVLERVVDGDTFYASGKKIRIWGIDAPEKDHPLFEYSSKALELFMTDARISCKRIDIDRYKREVMHCFADQTDIGAIMVKTGYAKDFKKYSGGFYDAEQRFAQKLKLGLWEPKL